MKKVRLYQRGMFLYTMLLLLIFTTVTVQAESYPAQCRVTTTLNVRQGPGTEYYKIGKLYRNDYIAVNSVTQNGSTKWGCINYRGQTGYVSIKYVSYIKPIPQQSAPISQFSGNSSSFSFSSFLEGAWKIIKYIMIGLLILLVFAFWEELLQIAIFVAILIGIGALVCKLLFNDASLGAGIGFVIAVLIGIKMLVNMIGMDYSNTFELIYRFVSFPFWFLNRLQHILMEPWRYITKGNISNNIRRVLLPLVYPAEIILYILITPLRFVNAINYNIIVYGITEIYDLFFEVLQPSIDREGKGNLLLWIVWFPIRLIKYPIIRGCLVLTEGAIWTVIDIFIPTITMYHGTDLTAAQSIVGNDWHKGKYKKWTDGTFCSSKNGWAGAGAYFGSSRNTAAAYAKDGYRLSDNTPVMIVCRLSLGKILNYGLAPRSVSDNTGPYGIHSRINQYAVEKGYITGEWWNDRAEYWEYCMFDWQNAYNHPWRIRPIYVFNFRTGLAQHVEGGFRHWLFSKVVIEDILKSTRFICLLIFAIIVVFWFVFGGWEIIWNEYFWYY